MDTDPQLIAVVFSAIKQDHLLFCMYIYSIVIDEHCNNIGMIVHSSIVDWL